MSRFWVVGLIVVSSLVATMGCTSSQEEAPSISMDEAILRNGERLDGLADQFNDLVAECMAEEGFDYVVPPDHNEDIEIISIYRIGVLASGPDADTYGWTTGLLDQLRDFAHDQDHDVGLGPLEGAEYELALYGSPEGPGCMELTQDRLEGYDDIFVNNELLHAGAEEVAERLTAHPAADQWSQCMISSQVVEPPASVTAVFDTLVLKISEILDIGIAPGHSHDDGHTHEESSSETHAHQTSGFQQDGIGDDLSFDADANRYNSSDPQLQDQLDQIYRLEKDLKEQDFACASEVGLDLIAQQIAAEVEDEVLPGLNL